MGDGLIVPLRFDDAVFVHQAEGAQFKALEKTSYLMIYKDKEDRMKVEWVTLLPISNNKGKFVGIIDIEEWNGKFKRGIGIGENGEEREVHLEKSITYSN
ncbi:hypothetical protein ACJVDK_08585 [Pedobacter sp. MW01-1-1]